MFTLRGHNVKVQSAEGGEAAATILIAEDDRRVRDSLDRYLRLEGYEVVAVGDGAAALAAHDAHRPDLLVLDVSMPNADGLSVRTPLTSLRTNVDLLRRSSELLPEDRDSVLEDLDAELGELTDLVTELVDLAVDVQADEALQLIELADVVEPVAERARRRSGRDIVMRVDRGVAVEGRPESLTRAMRNLVDNAVKFGERGPVEVVVDGGTVTVHDAGPGVPEAHGGTVTVGESPLGGAAFSLRIPETDD